MIGCPPTDLNALTGELTPPGNIVKASLKICKAGSRSKRRHVCRRQRVSVQLNIELYLLGLGGFQFCSWFRSNGRSGSLRSPALRSVALDIGVQRRSADEGLAEGLHFDPRASVQRLLQRLHGLDMGTWSSVWGNRGENGI